MTVSQEEVNAYPAPSSAIADYLKRSVSVSYLVNRMWTGRLIIILTTLAGLADFFLVFEALRKSAASSSAEPPISPIMMIDCVSGSLKNMSRQSMKLVPLTGSPPIPMQVVCPRPIDHHDR